MSAADSILPGIEHFVVVMFENRSFDNMLGGLYPDRTAAGKFDGVKADMSNCVDPYSPEIDEITVWQGDNGIDTKIMPYPDPGELFEDMNVQLFAPNAPPTSGRGEPTMGGFVYNYANQQVTNGSPAPRPRDVMQYFAPGSDGNLPIMTALAKAYAVSDAWFASGPVQTLVNRIFVHSGQPSTYEDGGETCNCTDNSTVTGTSDDPLGIVHVRTIFHLLDEKFGSDQINWKVYHNDFPISSLIHYVYERWGPDQQNVCSYFDQFADDIVNGQLPRYSFIEPRYTNMSWDFVCHGHNPNYQPTSYHPGGACPGWDANAPDTPPAVSVSFGERFLLRIYAALANHPDLFKKTLLIVLFDEHGGLFDHVPPPAAVPPHDVKKNFDFSRYGVRVPAIFINPHIAPGTVFRSDKEHPFDHTSIIATLREQFDLGSHLTHRDKHAPTLAGLLNPETVNPFSPHDLPKVDCDIPPEVDRGLAVPDISDPNNLHAIIHRGIKSAREKGKL